MYRPIGILLAVATCFGSACPATADFIFTTLQGYTANGIHDSGQIVGQDGGGGFLFSGGTYTTINVPSPDRLAATIPNGINNASQVVGTYFSGSGAGIPALGFLYSGGQYSTFQAPGASSSGGSQAYGINNAGQIVGNYKDNQGAIHGFLLAAGIYTRIDVPGATFTSAMGINGLAQIVGGYDNFGFLMKDGSYTTLHVPGSLGTVASGINDSGQIVGWYDKDRLATHGFVLLDGTYYPIDFPGSTGTAIFAVNNYGGIVGQYYDSRGNAHGFVAIGSPIPEASSCLLLAIAVSALFTWEWIRHGLTQLRSG